MSNKDIKLIEFSVPDFIRIGDSFINLKYVREIVFLETNLKIDIKGGDLYTIANYPEGKTKKQMMGEFKLYCVRYRDEQTNS